jgi:hypothetical protein
VLPEILRSAGIKVVTHRERYGRTPGIQDPQVIADCGMDHTILLTADADLETTWAAEIRKAKIGVVILSNNTYGAAKWGHRIIQGMEEIILQLRKRKKPYALRLNRQGQVNHVRMYYKKSSRVIPL